MYRRAHSGCAFSDSGQQKEDGRTPLDIGRRLFFPVHEGLCADHFPGLGQVGGLEEGGIGVFDILHANQITGLAGRDIWSAGWFVLLIGIGLALIFGNGRFEIRTDKGGKWDRWGGWRSRWNWVFGPHDASTVIGMGDLYYGRKPWALDGDLTLRHRAGDVRIDLTTAEIKDGSHRVELAVGAGDVVVLVPDWCSANVRATVGVGNLDVFDEVRQGLKVSMEKSEVVPDATVTLHIDVRLGAGNLEVRRVPSRRVEG